jgi:hypothetical protein
LNDFKDFNGKLLGNNKIGEEDKNSNLNKTSIGKLIETYKEGLVIE